jgi:hypothetical protein
MGSGARRAILGCVCGLAAVVPPTSLGVSAASASTLSFSNHCCYDLRIDADALPNRLHLRTDNQRIVLHDATPGATISFRRPGSRCVGEGTATLDCARGSLVTPITVLIDLGPGDSFDTGDHGCAGGGGFALAGGSRASPGPDEVTVWGGSYPDQFSSFGRGVVHGCGGADQLNATRGTASGGGGPDFIGARSSARLRGGPGTDQLIAADGGTASGGRDDDELYDTEGRSTLRGDRGNDQVGDRFCVHEDQIGDGRDRMFGGPGHDYLAAGCISKPVKGEPGAQRLVPTEPDFLDGGPDNDGAQAGHQSEIRRVEHTAWLPRIIR